MNRHRQYFGILALVPLLLIPGDTARGEWDVDGLEVLLPHHETAAERLLWAGREHEMPGLDLRTDPPPVGPLRNSAEWEPCTGVLIRYPLGLPYTLLRDFDDQVTLHVVVSSGYLSTAETNLAANGVDMDQVEFLVRPNDSIWTRDYGPWFVFDGAGDISIINHTYNRPWRPNDNLIPLYFGQQQGIPVYSHDMYHTGGNYMTDGAHISSSTQLVYDEALSHNGMTSVEVDQLMFDYYGILSYQVLEYIESGGIHHIDTWAKFLDEEAALVKEVWSSHWTYTPLEERATLLASLRSSTGRNYQVHRVYCYNIGGNNPASYTNSLILNDVIYMPLFGNTIYDDEALAAYQEAAPGYSVQGYSYGGWLTDDALHCRAKGVMDSGMLRVGHIPILEEQQGDVVVTAYVRAHSNFGLDGVYLYWQREGDVVWQQISMEATGADIFSAVIPAPTQAETTNYYILATDLSGREEGAPRVAPASSYSFSHLPGVTGIGERSPGRPAVLHQNYPNPFNPQTTFSFELLNGGPVQLVVLDARGRVVRRLMDGIRPEGLNSVTWDGNDDSGRPLSAGVYYYRLRAAGIQYSRAATLVK